MEVPGYELCEQVFKSPKTLFFKGIRKIDRKAVLVKTINTPFPSVIDRANYKNEYEIMRKLRHDSVLEPVGLEMDRNCFALVLEDFDGRPSNPDEFMNQYGLEGFLETAIRVADFLGDCHSQKIIHRNLKPHNILVCEKTGMVKVLGFLLTSLRDDNISEDRLQQFIGMLEYISPEQTGRLNRNVDLRSDLYSLGVTLYHLLTGRLPFSAEDPMALVHCHIAVQPESPHQRDNSIPASLSDIIMKCLSKSPEDRYQSAFGLAEDLRTCLENARSGNPGTSFEIATRDVAQNFQIPSRLYGRTMELEVMESALAASCCGERRFLSIVGASGMGKSELVNEIHGPISTAHGYFISGKYDNSKQNVPYLGFVMAIENLVHQILAESPAQVNRWREKLLEALDGNGQVIVDVVPDLEMILGKQEPVPVLATAEARNRFQMTMRNFISVVATREHPLTIFLDDMQWSGETTCQLMTMILTDSSINHLLLISAYRPGSASPDTALGQMIKELGSRGVTCDRVELGPLREVDVQVMLRDVLSTEPSESKELASLIIERTGGRLFDIGVFLEAIHDDQLLNFNPRLGRWQYDVDTIREKTMERSAGDVIIDRFRRLPEATQSMIRVAACLGHRFSLRMLSIASQRNQSDTAAHLRAALEDGMIIPHGDAYRLLEVYDAGEIQAAESHLEISFRFRHNQVHQAIYSLMDDDQSMETHLKVGQRLARDNDSLEGDIFNVVNQLNHGRHLVKTDSERVQLARLNLRAGDKAMSSMAWGHALDLLKIALDLMPEDTLNDDFELWRSIHMSLAEAEGSNNNLEEARSTQDKILAHTKDTRDKARVYMQRVLLLHNGGRLEEAVSAGIEGLELFGLSIPSDSELLTARVNEEMSRVRQWMADHDLREMLDLPAADESNRECMQLLMFLTPAAFNTNQTLFRLIALLQVRLSLEDGNTSDSPYAFAVLGILLGATKEYKTGYEVAQLAGELAERYPDPVIRYKLDFIGCNLINHFACHLKEDLPVLTRVYHNALRYGDLVWANYAVLVDQQHRWVLDLPLLEVLNEGEQYVKFAQQAGNRAVLEALRYINNAVLNMRGLTYASDTLDSDDFQGDDCVRVLEDAGYYTGLSVYYVINMQVLYIRGHYRKALEMGAHGEELITYSANTLMMTVHHFFYSLTMAMLYPTVSEQEQEQFLIRIRAGRDHLRLWAENCPENFKHRYQLVQAELDRIQGRDYQALNLYQDAIRSATDEELPMNEAIAHEMAARFFKARGFASYVEFHLKAAIHCFEEWGAIAKAADLHEKNAAYLEHSQWSGRYGMDKVSEREAAYSRAFDMTTLMKTSQTISGEFRVDRLLKKLMQLVLENAGAQRGGMVLMREGEPMVEAFCDVSEGETRLTGGVPMDEYGSLPLGVIRYVLRTKAPLVISDVARNPQYRVDDYMRSSGVKAMLCMPIMRQTEITGILYLENQLAAEAFSADRVEMLRLLAPQIAISIENARFVSEMTELNRNLEAEIQERKKAEEALRKAQRIALANARNAAKAEFANSVLHNINNVLNSVGLSSEMVMSTLNESKMEQLARLAALVSANKENPVAFFTENPKGQLIPKYLTQLARVLGEEHRNVQGEMSDLSRNLKLMRNIIEKQQADAKGVLRSQAADLAVLLEDALKVQSGPLQQNKVEVVRNYFSEQPVQAEKTQLTHILINLIKNAVEAMAFTEKRTLTLTIHKPETDQVCLDIRDSGVGITGKDLNQMFTHGFTTKKNGHGFGLHYCAKAMRDMGGSIEVSSDGRDKGAAFHLKFKPAT